MNSTILALCIAAGIGLVAGLVVLLRLRAVADDVLVALAPASPWQRQLAAWNQEAAEARREREAAVAVRADTLRNIYLADLAAAAEKLVEVSPR